MYKYGESIVKEDKTKIKSKNYVRISYYRYHCDCRLLFSYENTNYLIIGIAIFIFLYAAGYGLRAAVWTDAIQSMFILILTAMLIPFAMIKINSKCGTEGISGAFEAVAKTILSV